MAFYREENDSIIKNYGRHRNVVDENEWSESDNRADSGDWVARYQYEANIILNICRNKGYKKIIEYGSGPGVLGNIICNQDSTISYTYVDKIGAKKQFETQKRKGRFLVKDLMDGLDISELDTDYDLVVANDFLEHVANPSDILYKSGLITKDKSGLFISVPNWRMGHTFIYRGLFDYDNFIYFCDIHGWAGSDVYESPLKCPYKPKLSTEELMPDEIIQSWNWYYFAEKKTDF